MQLQGKRMTRTRRLGQQRGGTFLGLVLGLIVGLAIAVVVALYITKSPAPFQQKNAPPRPAEPGNVASVLPTPGNQQQQEPQDPNKPLWSKTPARPVGQPDHPVDTVPEPGQSTPSAPVQPPVARTPPERPSRSTPPPSRETPSTQPQPGDRMGERGAMASTTPDRPEKAAPREKPVADPIAEIAAADAARTSYLLQVGAFRSSEDADRQKANLAMQGFEAKITDRDVNGVKMYRVRLGPFAKVDDMNRARDRLQTAGFESSVIRFTRQ